MEEQNRDLTDRLERARVFKEEAKLEFDRLMVIPETRVCARHAIMADEADGVDANPREADGNADEA